MSGYKIDRLMYALTSVKRAYELEPAVDRALRSTDLTNEIEFTVYDFLDVDLLDTVHVFIEQEYVNQYMYVKGITYTLDQNNVRTTKVTLTTFINLED